MNPTAARPIGFLAGLGIALAATIARVLAAPGVIAPEPGAAPLAAHASELRVAMDHESSEARGASG